MRLMGRVIELSWVVAFTVFLTACGPLLGPGVGDDDDDNDTTSSPTPSGTGTPNPVEYSGYVSMGFQHVDVAGGSPVDAAYAAASFYDPIDTTGGTVEIPNTDDCVVQTPGTTPPTPSITYRDAGTDLTLSGPTTVSLMQAFNGNQIYYTTVQQPLPTSQVTPGGQYDVSWSGGADMAADTLSGVMVVPDPILMSQPTFQTAYVLSGDVSVQWNTSGVGSDTFYLYITTVDPNNTSNYATAWCAPVDDGSFTVPASIISQLPAGVGNMGVARTISNEPAVGDGTVISVLGTSSHYGPVEK